MIIIDNEYNNWNNIKTGNISLYYMRNKELNTAVSEIIANADSLDMLINDIGACLRNNNDYTSGIYEDDNYIAAWVDHIRSTPVYYSNIDDKIFISNNPRDIQKEASLYHFDDGAELQFAMSGYVTGSDTLICDLKTLQPGEFIIWDKSNKALKIERYYQYLPDFINGNSWKENKDKINSIIDDIIVKIIKRANDKTIWVPLSAGLDSRIILCKLHEHGYRNIKTFTYGPKYNFESKYAKNIAKALNVPWQEIILPNEVLKNYFDSDIRKSFWRYADGLKSIPCMREFSAIYHLHENNIAKSGDIFINGQSGDYITGGHIPEDWCDGKPCSMEEFFTQIVDKHYDLWFDLKTINNLKNIKNGITKILHEYSDGKKSGTELAKYSESWEYDGRQICYVVNGQRTYEFFGYDWEMPLWEKTLVDFCQGLSLEQKKGQALYKSYLKDYNYKGLFPEKEPYIWRWPANNLWVVAVAQIDGAVRGRKSTSSLGSLDITAVTRTRVPPH